MNRGDKDAEDGDRNLQSQSHEAVEHWLATNIHVRVVIEKDCKRSSFQGKGGCTGHFEARGRGDNTDG